MGLEGAPEIAAGLALGWHAEHMRDRACPGGSGLPVPARPLSLRRPLLSGKKQQGRMLQGSSAGPHPTNLYLLQVKARCVRAAAVGQTPVPLEVRGTLAQRVQWTCSVFQALLPLGLEAGTKEDQTCEV